MRMNTDSKGLRFAFLQALKWCDVFVKWAVWSEDSSLSWECMPRTLHTSRAKWLICNSNRIWEFTCGYYIQITQSLCHFLKNIIGPMSVDSTEGLRCAGKYSVSVLSMCRLSSCPSLSSTVNTEFPCVAYANNVEIQSLWVDVMGYMQMHFLRVIYVCTRVTMYLYAMYVQCLQRPGEGIKSTWHGF